MKNVQSINGLDEATVAANPRDVLMRHLSAFRNNDLQAVVSDYTSESVLITPDAAFTGPHEIKAFFAGLIAQFPKEGSSFDLDKVVVSGELVYIIWHGRTPTLDVPFATDTFIIKNGKILQQTFAGQMKSVF